MVHKCLLVYFNLSMAKKQAPLVWEKEQLPHKCSKSVKTHELSKPPTVKEKKQIASQGFKKYINKKLKLNV